MKHAPQTFLIRLWECLIRCLLFGSICGRRAVFSLHEEQRATIGVQENRNILEDFVAERFDVKLIANILDLKRERNGRWLMDGRYFPQPFLLTNSNISSISSNCFNSFRDSLCVLLILLDVPFWLGCEPAENSFCVLMLRKVGVPSMVFTMGFSSPPRSNSCAEIFLHERNLIYGIVLDQSQFSLITSQVWLHRIHCVTNIAADSCASAIERASSCRCRRGRLAMRAQRAMSRPRFLLPFAWNSSERTLDSRQATLPCACTRHRSGLDGDSSRVAVATGRQRDYVRAPNLCPLQQRAFWFGAPLYFADAVLEERRLKG